MSHGGHTLGAGGALEVGLGCAFMPHRILSSPRLRSVFVPAAMALLAPACATGGLMSDAGGGGNGDVSSFTPGTDTGTPGPDGSSIFAQPDAVVLGGGDAGDSTTPLPDGGGSDVTTTSMDATLRDGGMDSSVPDSSSTDAGHDVSAQDAASHDAAADAVSHETGTVDAATPDSGSSPCALTHLVISQVQSRGTGGGNDEFIELYNPTSAAVTLDSTWSVEARSNSASSFTARWTGTTKSIPSLGHYLLVGTAYSASVASDAPLTSGVTDASAVRLTHSGVTVDELCYAYSSGTTTTLEAASYDCPGTPAANPHDDTTATNTSASLERGPGGAAGNCTDTGSSATDFKKTAPSTPRDTSSPAAP